MNTNNVNTPNTDANDEAAKTLADMFTGAAIEGYSINGGTITLTLVGGDTIAIRHETKETDFTSEEFGYIREEREHVSEGITPRAAEAIKNGQAILAAWVEKRETYESHTPYDEYDETPDTTTETIELWVMFEGDLRPTRLTSNETTYTWEAHYPDFRLTHGEVTVHADSAHIKPDSTRPWR